MSEFAGITLPSLNNGRLTILGIIGIAFGALTIFSGGSVLFGGEAARLAAGNFIPAIVWFNFAAGFAYVLAGLGLLARRQWAVTLSALIAGLTLAASAILAIYVWNGGAYEMRTVGAMMFRSVVWGAIFLATRKITDLK